MAMSKITEHGLGYYAPNDVTSWLTGFNVLVLKIEEILTTMDSVDEETRAELEETRRGLQEILDQHTNSITNQGLSITQMRQTLEQVTNTIEGLASKTVVEVLSTKMNDIFPISGTRRTVSMWLNGGITTANQDLYFTIPCSLQHGSVSPAVEFDGLTVRQGGKYLIEVPSGGITSQGVEVTTSFMEGFGIYVKLSKANKWTNSVNNQECSIWTRFTVTF